MSFPIRCFTCGKVTGNLWEEYEVQLSLTKRRDADENKILDKMKLRRFCCRRMFKSHVPEIENVLLMYQNIPGTLGVLEGPSRQEILEVSEDSEDDKPIASSSVSDFKN